MPAKNIQKKYLIHSFYHVYNRGSRKGEIFYAHQDYETFLRFVFQELAKRKGQVRIFPFCLLPNHFHFLLYQLGEFDMPRFMKSLAIRYAMYYKRICPNHSGCVFQGTYCARRINTLEGITQVKEYILANPFSAGLENWEYVGFVEPNSEKFFLETWRGEGDTFSR